MKTVAELVQLFAVNADGWHFETDEDARRHDDALEKLLEQDRRDTVEATRAQVVEEILAARQCGEFDPYAPEDYLRKVIAGRSLSPKGTTAPKGGQT